MEVTIHNIPEFIELLDERSLTSSQICKVLEKGFKIFAEEDLTPGELKEQLINYWNKYGNKNNRPIFLNNDFDIDGFLKEQAINNRLWTEYKTDKAARIASIYHNKKGIVGSIENNTYYLLGEPVLNFTIPKERQEI